MAADKPSWTLTGVVLVACNCDFGCPCNFNAPPTHGKCEGGWTWHVQHGSFDGVSLDGLNFSVYANWPGAIHEGNGVAQIVDVRIKRADLPEGTPLQSAYQRMKTARQQEARSIRAQGMKQAQIIRAEADAEAAQIYAAAFGKDPDFYDFYRAMQSYQTTFIGDGGETPKPTTVILSPNNDYLKEFTGRSR